MRKLAAVLFISFTILFQACQNYEDFRELDTINYEPEVAIPLINSSITIDDALQEMDDISFLSIDDEGLITINYESDLLEQGVAEHIAAIENFPLFLVDSFMSVPIPLFDNISVSKLHLKTGTMSFEIQSNHAEDIQLSISLPGMKRNGIPFEISTSIPYGGSTPVSASIAPESLAGYEMTLDDGKVDIRYEAFTTSGTRVLLDGISGEAENWTFSQLDGVWGNESFALEKDTISFELSNDWIDGEISFSNPKIKINLSNSIGMPLAIKLQDLTAYTKEGNAIPISSTFEDGFKINYPSLSEIGEEKSSLIVIDKTNSNIVSVINAIPEYITYEVVVIINPDESTATGFISENSMVKSNIEIELPIQGSASGIKLEADTDFTMEDIDEVEYATFKLVTDNEIPIDLNLQLYFMDGNQEIIDSLFDGSQLILGAPMTAANGTVLNSTETINFIDISPQRMQNIQRARVIRTKAAFSTSNSGTVTVSIRNHQKLSLKMGAILGL